MGQHIRRDLSFYDGNSNRTFFARTVTSVGLAVKAIASQTSALFGVYDKDSNLIAGFESDGDVFGPNFISRQGQVNQFDLNTFYDDITFGDNSSITLDEANSQIVLQTNDSLGDTYYSFLPITNDPNGASAASLLTETKIYTQTISALKLLNAVDGTSVQIAGTTNYAQSKVLGIAKFAGNIGDSKSVILFGKVEDATFIWPVNTLLYLDSNGSITDIAPVTGFLVNIGYSLGSGAIFLNIQEPIQII